jgi:hypothetical protein
MVTGVLRGSVKGFAAFTTRAFAKEGRNLETGSVRANRPRSINISAATEVIGLVMEYSLNIEAISLIKTASQVSVSLLISLSSATA